MFLKIVTDCTRQYTQSRSPPPAYRPARAAATPTTLRLPPPRANGYKGKAGEPRKGSSPGARCAHSYRPSGERKIVIATSPSRR